MPLEALESAGSMLIMVGINTSDAGKSQETPMRERIAADTMFLE